MHKRLVWLLLAALLLPGLAGLALAAAPDGPMAIDRWVMGGTAELRAAGPLTLQATAGQPAIGISGGDLWLSWGYWPGAPRLGYLPLLKK